MLLMERMNTGDIIRRERERLGLTLAKLSERCGIDASQLSKMERGLLGVSVTQVVQIASALGLPASVFVGADPAPNAAKAIPIEPGLMGDGLVRSESAMMLSYPAGLPRRARKAPPAMIQVDIADANEAWFALRAVGPQRSSEIQEGDVLIFEPTGSAQDGQIVLVAEDGDVPHIRIGRFATINAVPVALPLGMTGFLASLEPGAWRVIAVAVQLRRDLR